jgi:beta-1,4-mannosyl-glycoprotein beta-1,4-N-acetylglucosaminyltransferase
VTRPLVVDSFMVNNEFEMLECRLDTMAPAVDYFLAIEASVDHQNHPKPYHITENLDRFKEWRDKLIVVQAHDLPDTPHKADPWAREWAQRDWTWAGLAMIEERRAEPLPDDTIVLHGDLDEICDPLYVRNVRPKYREFVAFDQRWHCFALDWVMPDVWGGTVAVTLETARSMRRRQYVGDELWHPGTWQIVRNQRNGLQPNNFVGEGTGWASLAIPNSGWHFTWLGGKQAALAKLGSFCHPEVEEIIHAGLQTDMYLRQGQHVDGRRQFPCEIDDTYPQWVQAGKAPATWYRPRGVVS